MNHSPPPDLWDDPRITAYATGELSGDAAAQFEVQMASDAGLTAAVAAAGRTLDAASDQLHAHPPAKLPPVAIESILATAAARRPMVRPRSRSWARLLMPWAAVAACVAVVVGLSIPAIQEGRQTAMTMDANVGAVTAPAMAVESLAAESIERSPEPFDPVPAEPSRYANNRKSELAPSSNNSAETPHAPVATAGLPEPAAMAMADRSTRQQTSGSPAFADDASGAFMGLGDMFGTPASNSRASSDESSPHREMRGMGMAEEMSRDGMNMQMGMGMDFEMAPAFGDLDPSQSQGGDLFDLFDENEFKRVAEHPLSTFSIDVDTASYAKVRSYLNRGQLPPPGAVRIEELINYFQYDYAAPRRDSDEPFRSSLAIAGCPWNDEHRLLRVGIAAQRIERDRRPPCNLMFLIDTSGSMNAANKLPLVIDGMRILLEGLDDRDRVGIVTYAGNAGLVLDSTPADQTAMIRRALTRLRSGGSTNGGAGLQLAYDVVADHYIENGVNRVVLCSDGDFNVGTTSTDQLVRLAETRARDGIELSVLGFGMGNHNDAMMERVSNRGAGNYAFIDTIAEAEKVLVDQLAGTLVTVAADVKLQIEFNPAVVSAYRLIGYENRMLAKEEFNDDTKDAGEIGAGHQVTALYELVPAGVSADAAAPPVDSLKYQNVRTPTPPDPSAESLTLKIRYKRPGESASDKLESSLVDQGVSFDQADSDFRWATAVAGYGQLLRGRGASPHWSWDEVIATAEPASGDESNPLRQEFLELLQIAAGLSTSEIP